ncbi:MAG: hypothetical protein ABJ092_10595 [Gillisia sp.]
MNKFHIIPTDKFVPISHDNSYLFNHYNKVANFLAFNLENNYKTILAKPVQNGYSIEWFSIYNDLKDIKEYEKDLSEIALSEYWNFIGVINAKISELQNSNNENNKNWAGLLQKVFHHNDNFIFFNGSNISIIWGWKFENTENYVPNFLKPQIPGSLNEEDLETPVAGEIAEIQPPPETEEEIEEPPIPVEDEQEDKPVDEVEEEIIMGEIIHEENPEEKEGFLEFLKWFAAKYWWLLILLITLIMIVLFIKTI